MHEVSDGQRQSVQIVCSLLEKFEVLLLDEVTVDLDILARAALLKFLREEENCTIMTRCVDGLHTFYI